MEMLSSTSSRLLVVLVAAFLSTALAEFVGQCSDNPVNETESLQRQIQSNGVCELYRGQATECNPVIEIEVDYVYIPWKRIIFGVEFFFSRVNPEISNMISSLPERCREVFRPLICNYYFIPCGRNDTTFPPQAICRDECEYFSIDLCPDGWQLIIQYFEGISGQFKLDMPNCSNPGEILEPQPHCCANLGLIPEPTVTSIFSGTTGAPTFTPTGTGTADFSGIPTLSPTGTPNISGTTGTLIPSPTGTPNISGTTGTSIPTLTPSPTGTPNISGTTGTSIPTLTPSPTGTPTLTITGNLDSTQSKATVIIASMVGGGGGLLIIAVVVALLIISVVCLYRRHKCHRYIPDSYEIEMNNIDDSKATHDYMPPKLVVEDVDAFQQSAYGVTLRVPGQNVPRVPSTYMRQMSGKLLILQAQLQLMDCVGQGEFGVVYRARWTGFHGESPEIVAVKTLKALFTKNDIDQLMEESLIMKDFDHPNVLNLIGVCVDGGPAPYLVVPFMANGSLLKYLKRERPKLTIAEGADSDLIEDTQKKLLSMCLQIARGMEYLAEQKFVHRDLAARNCMIDVHGLIKVADFGLSEDIYKRNYFRQKKEDDTVKLPFKWMALESLQDGIFTEKTDVWSFGITCWEVFSAGRTPYPGVDPFILVQFLEEGKRLNKPSNAACSDKIYNTLMLHCWRESVDERPAFLELVKQLSIILEAIAGYIDFNNIPRVITDMENGSGCDYPHSCSHQGGITGSKGEEEETKLRD